MAITGGQPYLSNKTGLRYNDIARLVWTKIKSDALVHVNGFIWVTNMFEFDSIVDYKKLNVAGFEDLSFAVRRLMGTDRCHLVGVHSRCKSELVV